MFLCGTAQFVASTKPILRPSVRHIKSREGPSMLETAHFSARCGLLQRKIVRQELHVRATLRQRSRQRFPISVTDISARGCGVETRETLVRDTPVWLRLPGLESWFATVAWAEAGRAGLDFDRPLHPAVFEKLVADHEAGNSLARWTREMTRRFG